MRKTKKSSEVTTTYQLFRYTTIWDWEGASDWEEVGARAFWDFQGRFDSVADMITYVEHSNIDGLYRWCRVECPLDDGTEWATVEWSEGRWL